MLKRISLTTRAPIASSGKWKRTVSAFKVEMTQKPQTEEDCDTCGNNRFIHRLKIRFSSWAKVNDEWQRVEKVDYKKDYNRCKKRPVKGKLFVRLLTDKPRDDNQNAKTVPKSDFRQGPSNHLWNQQRDSWYRMHHTKLSKTDPKGQIGRRRLMADRNNAERLAVRFDRHIASVN